MIYLDYNATTPLDSRVLEAMTPFMTEKWGNPSSPYSFGNQSRLALEKARTLVAECLGARADEIVFTGGGTESDNLALRGTAQALKSRGTHIITTVVEHHAVLNTCKSLESEGYQITYLPVSADGVIDMEALEKSIRPQTILISIMHANNETGVLQPIEAIAQMARKRGVVFHTDAVQTAGKLPVQLCATGADLISLSGHKFYGPKGTGALYIRRQTPLSARITGGPHERGFRAGTENVPGIIGLAKALSLAMESADSESRRLAQLRNRVEERLREAIPDVLINGAGAPRISNTVSLSFGSVDGESIVLGLDLAGIYISTGSACSTGDPEPSHVLLAMGHSPKMAQGSVRISMGRHTKETDSDAVVDALAKTVSRLRTISSI